MNFDSRAPASPNAASDVSPAVPGRDTAGDHDRFHPARRTLHRQSHRAAVEPEASPPTTAVRVAMDLAITIITVRPLLAPQHSDYERLREELARHVAHPGGGHLVLDATRVRVFSDEACRLIIECWKLLAESGRSLVLTRLPSRARKLMRASGAAGFVDIQPSWQQAVRRLRLVRPFRRTPTRWQHVRRRGHVLYRLVRRRLNRIRAMAIPAARAAGG